MEELPPASTEQMVCVEALMSGSNVLVRAQAGAGKSTTFFHAAQAWLAEQPHTHIALLCYNVNLRSASEKRVERLGLSDNVHCYTIHSLASRMFGTAIGDTMTLHKYLANDAEHDSVSPHAFSLALIDEGQDLAPTMVRVINVLQRTLHDTMRYMVVGDLRQAIYGFTREEDPAIMVDPEGNLRRNGAPWTTCKLLQSFRITTPVAALLNEMFRHPTDDPIIGANTRSAVIRPTYVVGSPWKDLLGVVDRLLGQYRPDQIMVLAPSVRTDSYGTRTLAELLSEQRRVPLFITHKRLTEVSPELLEGKLVISSFHQSKGDERDCVVVLGADLRHAKMRGYPERDGHPDVDNALHVALTRVREKLVLFVDAKMPPYPSVNCNTLAAYCDIQLECEQQPQELAPTELRMIERSVSWAVEFATEETLEALGQSITIDPPLHVGPPVVLRPASVARMRTGITEDVASFFNDAILAAAHRQRLTDLVGGGRRFVRSWLEDAVRSKMRRQEIARLPPLYRSFWETLEDGDSPDGPCGWLKLSVLYQVCVHHRYAHELHQIADFDWVTPDRAAYFVQCVNNLTELSRRHEVFEFEERGWREESERYRVRIRDTLQYTSGGVRDMPWRFSFADEPTEEDCLVAVFYAWLRHGRHANIFCVPSNCIYRVHIDDPARIVHRILAAKRNIDYVDPHPEAVGGSEDQ